VKPIFTYIDYRRFLSDFYQEKKRTGRHFSYRYFARRAGFASPVFLKLVIEGKRNLSRAMIPRYCTALGLNPKQSCFFEHLVLFNQAKTSIEKQEHYAVMVSMIGKVAERQVEVDQYGYFSHWYTPVILELACRNGFTGDGEALAAMLLPPIKPKEARASVDLLLRLKLIERNDDGTLRRTNAALHGGAEVAVLSLRSFNRQMVERALHAIDALPTDQRHASGVTAGISMRTYNVIEAEIEAFKDRIIAIANNDEGSDCVCQLNIQLFPLSKPIVRKSGGAGGPSS
jgi:uncharacterized protein (TIGR02147 family)